MDILPGVSATGAVFKLLLYHYPSYEPSPPPYICLSAPLACVAARSTLSIVLPPEPAATFSRDSADSCACETVWHLALCFAGIAIVHFLALEETVCRSPIDNFCNTGLFLCVPDSRFL
ncbi:MAG TPA: hypothetical protein PKE63_02405 [Lacibacter sp.]|nr:hypothetical protein [Lacibacter sp.]HMO89433.1 hypothetical protein [Lacibacter sp.]HMP86097.1 hypothetical protein [Lacibacter sp.]